MHCTAKTALIFSTNSIEQGGRCPPVFYGTRFAQIQIYFSKCQKLCLTFAGKVHIIIAYTDRGAVSKEYKAKKPCRACFGKVTPPKSPYPCTGRWAGQTYERCLTVAKQFAEGYLDHLDDHTGAMDFFSRGSDIETCQAAFAKWAAIFVLILQR